MGPLMKVVALVDGEHYPSVTRWGLEVAKEQGFLPVAALLIGGIEKLGPERRLELGALPVVHAERDPRSSLAEARRH